MDADEVFHEDDFEKIKKIPDAVGSNIMGIKFNTLHFYKDYKHLLNGSSKWKDLYTNKVYMVRNDLGIHHGNSGMDIDAHIDRHGIPLREESIVHVDVSMFHYGHVRSEKIYLTKQNRMDSFYSGEKVDRNTVNFIDDKDLGTFKGNHPFSMKHRIWGE